MTLPRSGSGYGNGASNRSSPRTPGGARSQSWEDLALFPLTGGRSSAVSLGCNASSAASPAGGNARTASGSASSPWPSLSSGLMLYWDRLISGKAHGQLLLQLDLVSSEIPNTFGEFFSRHSILIHRPAKFCFGQCQRTWLPFARIR